jgi:hypothetical protein
MKNTDEKFPGTFVKVTSTVVIAVVICATVGILKKRNQASTISLNKTEMAAKTNTTLIRSNTRGFMNKGAFVNPPLKGKDIAFKKHTINADNGGSFTYNGSRVIIPAGIFCDEKGVTIKGKVDIEYREFHNPLDIFLSGIPMTYDSAGTKFTFESAGMLDIRGEQNGKPVLIKQGKNMEVEMASTTTNENYNIYVLDTVKKNWVFQEVSKPDLVTEQVPNKIENTKTDMEAPDFRKPIAPRRSNPENMSFRLSCNSKDFPEIASCGNNLFEVDSKFKSFDPRLASMTWNDFSLNRIGFTDTYRLTLTKDSASYTFVVYPVFDPKDFKKAQQDFIEKSRDYTKLLAQEKEEEKTAQLSTIASTFVIRRLNVPEFGVWNCDRVINAPAVTNIHATFIDSDNDTLNGTDVYMVDHKLNTVFRLYSFEPVRYDTSSSQVMWCVTKNDKIAIFTPEDFKKVNVTNGDYTFKMKVIDKEINSDADVMNLLGKYL